MFLAVIMRLTLAAVMLSAIISASLAFTWQQCKGNCALLMSSRPAAKVEKVIGKRRVEETLKRQVGLPIAAFLSAAALVFPDIAVGASPVGSGAAALEQAITRLEQVDNRGDTVQAMADLYEVVQAKPLLTRTRYKYRVINAINDKHRQLNNEWDQTLSYETSELKRAADPLRTVDLKAYLQVAPYIGGGLYLITLFIQRSIPEIFNFAYPISVFVLVSPVLFILLTT